MPASLKTSELRTAVEQFISNAAEPAVLDPGEEPLRLIAGQWSFGEWGGRLVLEAWNGERNLARKIQGLNARNRDRLVLATERFPKLAGELQIADLAAPAGREWSRRSSRTAFRERFQLMLAREFPDWRLEDVSIEANLEASLSPSFARAFLRSGRNGIAAMAAPPDSADCAGVLSFGLIWLDYLRRRELDPGIRVLLLYVPSRRASEVAFRLPWIDPAYVDCKLFMYDESDRAGSIDPADGGNVESTLPPARFPRAPNAETAAAGDLPEEVSRVLQSDGSVLYDIRGLEFGRSSLGKLTCGIARRSRCSPATLASMAREISRVRRPDTEDRQHPLYTARPEGWLESKVRENPQAIDASICQAPVYGQVPIFNGGERGVIDLLGIDHTGRLTVIELKATADLHLPLQALDYWLRVRKHLVQEDFERLGYFPGKMIRPEAPRILLVAPALEFHSTTETILRAFAPEIEVMRIGLAADWREELRVMFRLRGSETA